jgi:hypothetical protein
MKLTSQAKKSLKKQQKKIIKNEIKGNLSGPIFTVPNFFFLISATNCCTVFE